MKKYQEGASKEQMTDAGGEIEEQSENEGTQEAKEEKDPKEERRGREKVSMDDKAETEDWLTYKERVAKKAEEDDLSYLGEVYGDEEEEKQREAEGDDHPEVSEEEEWDDTVLEKEAQVTKKAQRKAQKESQEGKETKSS
jgi:hypothetical protein